MPFQLSPGVLVNEIDLTNVVPAVATSIGAMAGAFQKGPVGEITAIGSEQELVKVFGKPNGSNFETWFTAANFLQYGNALRIVRAESGITNATANDNGLLIKNTTDYLNNYSAGQGSVGEWAARTAGTHGNSLGVSVCHNATAYEQTFSGNAGTLGVTTGTPAIGATTVGVDTGGGSAGAGGAAFNVGDIVHFQEASGQEYEVTAISTDNLTIKQLDNPNGGGLKTALSAATNVRRRWRFYDLFDAAPGTSPYATGKGLLSDEIHVVVFDRTGDISGFRADTNGERTQSVLETFPFVSQAASAKTAQGGTNFYPDVIYNQSEFVYWMDHDGTLSNAGTDPVAGTTFASTAGKAGISDETLGGGTDDYAVTVGEL